VSLRARLVATLLALSAAALLVLGVITYASQRSFEEQRIDDQARAAQPAVEHAMADQFFGEPDAGAPGLRGRRRTFRRAPTASCVAPTATC
jgi:two-component system OmpR family sensor kinase